MVGDFMTMLTVLRLLPVATLTSFNAHVDSQSWLFFAHISERENTVKMSLHVFCYF